MPSYTDRMAQEAVLQTNGLRIPVDFPVAAYDRIYHVVERTHRQHALYEHHAGAWNALAYRFRAVIDNGDAFALSLRTHGPAPPAHERYFQEGALFDFFSAGFSAFECMFYGIYTIGAFIEPRHFSLATEREQQRVSPTSTRDALARAFPDDPLLAVIAALFADPEYQRWRETRNVLTHRSAPGRRMYLSVGGDDERPTEWKIDNSPLDESIAERGRRELSRMLTALLEGEAVFAEGRLR
jgi:hypothetical protein